MCVAWRIECPINNMSKWLISLEEIQLAIENADTQVNQLWGNITNTLEIVLLRVPATTQSNSATPNYHLFNHTLRTLPNSIQLSRTSPSKVFSTKVQPSAQVLLAPCPHMCLKIPHKSRRFKMVATCRAIYTLMLSN